MVADFERITQESKHMFVFQPGNGTRYKIFASKIDPDTRGYNLIVAWLSRDDMGGPAMLTFIGGSLDYGYFREKTKIKNEPDAVAILCFMREQFGVKVYLPHGYEDKKWVADGKLKSL